MTTTKTPKARKPKATPAAAVAAPATATAPTLSETINLSETFLADGTLVNREIFRFNRVFGGAYIYRRALFLALAALTPEAVLSFERRARNTMFWLCKRERARYYGTATRTSANDQGAKVGDPLPQLEFNTKADAVSYGNAIRAAMKTLQAAVFND